MKKLNLVTVVGHNATVLPHMIDYYKDMVDDIHVVVHREDPMDGILERVINLGIKPTLVVTEPKSQFNWVRVTELYHQVRMMKPDEWWIVSDDDEMHVYPKPIRELIDECDEYGYNFITGGFLDRIGKDGTFPVITDNSDIWSDFPLGGFFRYPMSGAMPNKVCVMRGDTQCTSGHHFVKIGDTDTWRERGWDWPERYPIDNGLVQIHHFKWESTVLKRLQDAANKRNEFTYWREFRKMYRNIKKSDWRIDIDNPEYMIEPIKTKSFEEYPHWKKLTEIIVNI